MIFWGRAKCLRRYPVVLYENRVDLPQEQGFVGHGVAVANERRVITQDQSVSFARFNSLCSYSSVSRSRECQFPHRESKSTSTIDVRANCSPMSALDGVIADMIIPPQRIGSLIGGSMFRESLSSERCRASNAHFISVNVESRSKRGLTRADCTRTQDRLS
jgi:hypothetical protein